MDITGTIGNWQNGQFNKFSEAALNSQVLYLQIKMSVCKRIAMSHPGDRSYCVS